MAYTASAGDLITQAMTDLGALASGEVPSAAEMTQGLASLNQLIDGWMAEALTVPTIQRNVFALVANQATYQIGPTAVDWVVTNRPVAIQRAGLVLNTVAPSIEYPLYMMTDEEYGAVSIKALTTVYPSEAYYNPTMPNGTFFLWPTPTVSSNQIALYLPTPLNQFTDATTAIALPPMYARALRYNLAVDLAPGLGREPSPTILGIATAALAAVKLQNLKPSILSIDQAFLDTTAHFSRYNIYSDTGAG
jgi:hypothetical protein